MTKDLGKTDPQMLASVREEVLRNLQRMDEAEAARVGKRIHEAAQKAKKPAADDPP